MPSPTPPDAPIPIGRLLWNVGGVSLSSAAAFIAVGAILGPMPEEAFPAPIAAINLHYLFLLIAMAQIAIALAGLCYFRRRYPEWQTFVDRIGDHRPALRRAFLFLYPGPSSTRTRNAIIGRALGHLLAFIVFGQIYAAASVLCRVHAPANIYSFTLTLAIIAALLAAVLTAFALAVHNAGGR